MTEDQALNSFLAAADSRAAVQRMLVCLTGTEFQDRLTRATSRLKKAAHAWVKAQAAARVAKSIDAKKIGVKGSDRSHLHRKAKRVLYTPDWMG